MEGTNGITNCTGYEEIHIKNENFEPTSSSADIVTIKQEKDDLNDESSDNYGLRLIKSEDDFESDYDENCELTQSDIEKEFEKSEKENSVQVNEDNDTTAYKCNICSEVFKIYVEFRAHRKQHFIEKRTCKLCQTVCQSISKLEIHMNGHLGLKPFKCSECDKNFVSKNQLKLHMRSHTDEKRYTCVKCGKAFRHLGSLRSHVATHNDIKLREFQCKTNVKGNKKVMVKKRNTWSNEEVDFFISLLSIKKSMGFWDGKRFRTTRMFDSLEKPMRDAGYKRDARQLIIKFKNLKAEYVKCKRHNSVKGNEQITFPFYDDMHNLLAEGQCGDFRSDNGPREGDIPYVEPEIIDVAASSKESDGSVCSQSSARLKHDESKCEESHIEKLLNTQREILDLLKNPPEDADDRFLDKYFDRQERMLTNFTNQLLNGFREIFSQESPEGGNKTNKS